MTICRRGASGMRWASVGGCGSQGRACLIPNNFSVSCPSHLFIGGVLCGSSIKASRHVSTRDEPRPPPVTVSEDCYLFYMIAILLVSTVIASCAYP